MSAAGRETSREYDISAFVRKMEQLYDVLHRESRARKRHVAEALDLAFLTRPPTLVSSGEPGPPSLIRFGEPGAGA